MKKIRVAVDAENLRLKEAVLEALKWDGITAKTIGPGTLNSGKQHLREYDALILACETELFFVREYSSVPASVKQSVQIIGVWGEKTLGSAAVNSGCEFVRMMSMDTDSGRKLFSRELIIRIKVGRTGKRIYTAEPEPSCNSRFLVGIGCSAGGPKAVLQILKALPADTCGILLVQHLSRGFSGPFAQYLALHTGLDVKEARTGEAVRDGTVYLASDGCQMSVSKSGAGYILKNEPGEKVNGFAPSVDYLFSSIARAAAENAMGIILTGMGADGARGLSDMKKAGAFTVVQNRETSEIYNMPSAALLLGGADKQLPIGAMADEINGFCIRMRNKIRR